MLKRLWPRLDKVIFKPSKKMKLELLEARRRAARDKMSGVFFRIVAVLFVM